jgi:hypothetical protein
MKVEPKPTISVEEIRNALKALEVKGMIYYTQTGIYAPTEGGWKLLWGKGPAKDEIIAYGDDKISAKNNKEIKIVKGELSKKENSIICVRADKAAKDLNEELKEILKTVSMVSVTIKAGNITERIVGFGSPSLKIKSENSISLRKDDKVEEDTIAILCDKSAKDLKKELIEKLKNSSTNVKITIEAI